MERINKQRPPLPLPNHPPPTHPRPQGVRFKRLIMDESQTDRSPAPPPQPGVKRLVLCSGKIYYELAAERERRGTQADVALVRLEQLAPFPFDLVMRELRRYPGAGASWFGVVWGWGWG